MDELFENMERAYKEFVKAAKEYEEKLKGKENELGR